MDVVSEVVLVDKQAQSRIYYVEALSKTTDRRNNLQDNNFVGIVIEEMIIY